MRFTTRIQSGLLLIALATGWPAAAHTETMTEEELAGVWVGYVDGTQAPGWFMDIRPEGVAYFFGRTIKEGVDWIDGSVQDIPTYELLQTRPLVTAEGRIFQNTLSVFNHKTIPVEMQAGFDWSETSKLAVVMQTHGGAFALLPTPDEHPSNRDYWTLLDGVLGLKGHLFDIRMNGDILGFYPFAVCPYRPPTRERRFHPSCGAQQISWKKADKPTHTWKRVEGELLSEFMTYSVIPMLRLRRAGLPEAQRQLARMHGNSESFEDILDRAPHTASHPIAGPTILGEGVPFPGPRITGNHVKLKALLDRGFGRWLAATMEKQDITVCDFYLEHVRDEKTLRVLRDYCSGESTEKAASIEKPAVAKNAMAEHVASLIRSAGKAQQPLPVPAPAPAPAPASFPEWEVVGLWDYDAIDGQLLLHGLTLVEQTGSAGPVSWQAHLELTRHAQLPPRNRRLWPVKINRNEKRVCVNAPYPTYSGHVDLPGKEFDGSYVFASCTGDSDQAFW